MLIDWGGTSSSAPFYFGADVIAAPGCILRQVFQVRGELGSQDEGAGNWSLGAASV